jgi:UDP-N-acetylglucosamine 2-epimerase (non-hydrolysing)
VTRVLHVTGARPNLPKAAPVLRALAARGVEQTVVHTGQHRDDALTRSLLDDLGMPAPDVDLGVGPGSVDEQTEAIRTRLERLLRRGHVDLVVVYGDVTSTLAAALAAAHVGVRLAHVEAGLRCFDRSMPEEHNRVVVDHLADVLLAPSDDAVENLGRESVPGAVHLVGNVMIDSLQHVRSRLDPAAAAAQHGLDGPYAVATLHRPGNVDTDDDAARTVDALRALASRLPVVLPLHPRGRARLESAGLAAVPRLTVVEPLGYVAFLSLVAGAACVLTDSGGVQEETSVLGVPCLTLRPSTERPVTVSRGPNRLVTLAGLGDRVDEVLAAPAPGPARIPLWDGRAAERAADVLAGQAG